MFKELVKNIYKLDIPFDNVTTSSFLVVSEEGNILVDCGAYPDDVTSIILPALNQIKIKPDYLFLTHSHGDHAGGTETLLKEFNNLKLICFNEDLCNKYGGRLLKDNDEIIKNIRFLNLQGHSFDSGSLLDNRTNSLITGDCLQLFGIGKYGCGIGMPIEYVKSIRKLKGILPNNIFASHEYYPLGSVAFGSTEVNIYLEKCEQIYGKLVDFTMKAKDNGISDTQKIAEEWEKLKRKSNPDMPFVPPHTFNAILSYKREDFELLNVLFSYDSKED